MGKLTTDEFIKKTKVVHGDRYDYSKVRYENTSTKICIICKKHGEFWQTPYSHLNGHGCSKCAYEGERHRHFYSQKEIIEKLRFIFGDRYSYEKVVFKAMKVPITIVCHEKDKNGVEHGDFSMRPVNIFSSHQGCPKCYDDRRSRHQRKPVEIFIEEAKKIHGDLYEYHKVEYNNTNSKVCIVCKIHGDFWQTPSNHLRGKGCPYCSGNAKKWNKKTCEQEARKYEYIFDFRTKSPGACNVAIRNGWLKEYIWLKRLPPKSADYDKNTKYIYAYEFVEQKAVYVGLTNSMIKRDWQHRNSKDSSVYRFAEECGCDIPIPKQLESSVPVLKSGEREKYWVESYKNQGWHLLNRAKTGERESSVGIYYPIKWNKKAIREKAKECEYVLTVFAERYPGAYEAIQSRYKGLLNELFPTRTIHTHHTVEDALLVVNKGHYENRSQLRFDCIWAYRILFEKGLLDDVFGKPKEYTKEEALIEANEYNSIEQIRRDNRTLWNYLKENDLFKEAKPDSKRFRNVKTVEEAWELSLKYKNRKELRDHAGVAFKLLKEHGLLDKRYPIAVKYIAKGEKIEKPQTENPRETIEVDFEQCQKIYEQCTFASEVKKRFAHIYRIAKKKGWHEELKGFCYGSTTKWTRAFCEEIVRKYTFLRDLVNNEPNVYNVIKKYHWDDLLEPLKRVQHAPYQYNIEEIKEICAPYKSRLELSKARKDIDNYCRKKGIDLYELNGWPNLRNRKVTQLLDGVEIATFSSISEAARAISVPRNRMWEHLQNGEPYKGYIWKYKD
ncbi:MAG: hypothetical protein IK075_08850 [Prevotella sp.]|nr:hypothetical protein [Prevotella sp.]